MEDDQTSTHHTAPTREGEFYEVKSLLRTLVSHCSSKESYKSKNRRVVHRRDEICSLGDSRPEIGEPPPSNLG